VPDQHSTASTEAYLVQPADLVNGCVMVPGDKSVSHRALLLGAIADGETSISGFLPGADCLATMAALRAMGVTIVDSGSELVVTGAGPTGLTAPDQPLDLGNSGTAIRLLIGFLAAQPFDSVLTGDASLRQRPMDRVAEPLRMMGADIETEQGRPPVRVRGGRELRGVEYALPVASAQLKSALLLAALYAHGKTTVKSPGPSRDHTERMLLAMGAQIETNTANTVSLTGPIALTGQRIEVPRDFSSAAFFVVAGLLGARDGLLIPGVGVNPTRTGMLQILREMGGIIELRNQREYGAEPIADLYVEQSSLKGIEIGADLVALSIDELPIVFIAAAAAKGRTIVTGAEELRYKESDRLSVMANGLRSLGISVDEHPDGLTVIGGSFGGGRVDSHGDHRVAMAFTIASLRANAPIEILDTAPVATSFPDFLDVASSCGLRLDVYLGSGDD
jgi:3-phosphoshikimate 1-carboxyvinyltransferase